MSPDAVIVLLFALADAFALAALFVWWPWLNRQGPLVQLGVLLIGSAVNAALFALFVGQVLG